MAIFSLSGHTKEDGARPPTLSLLSTLSGAISSMRHFAPPSLRPSGPKEELDPTKVFLSLFSPGRERERERSCTNPDHNRKESHSVQLPPFFLHNLSLSSLCLLPSFRPFARTWLKHRRRRDSRESGGRGPFFTSSFSLSVPFFFFFPSFSSPKREKGFFFGGGNGKGRGEGGERSKLFSFLYFRPPNGIYIVYHTEAASHNSTRVLTFPPSFRRRLPLKARAEPKATSD